MTQLAKGDSGRYTELLCGMPLNDPSVVLAPLHWPRGDLLTVGLQRTGI